MLWLFGVCVVCVRMGSGDGGVGRDRRKDGLLYTKLVAGVGMAPDLLLVCDL